MKVGVITLWNKFTNYGQVLQYYALQTVLEEHGHEAVLLKFLPTHRFKRERISKILKVYPIFYAIWKRLVWKRQGLDKKLESTGMEQWAYKKFNFSKEEYNSLDELVSNPPKVDCLIAGSDQIWLQSLKYRDNYAYYLDFYVPGARKISYAPSFGMEKYQSQFVPELTRLLKGLDAVSVREIEGVRICKECGVEAAHVCDPTMLLTAADYERLIKLEKIEREDIFIYNINIREPEDIRWGELLSFANKNELAVSVAQGVGFDVSLEIFGKDVTYYYMNLGQWLECVKNSKFVVASSFHCVVFSILFNTPFVYAPIKGNHSIGNNRAIGLMKKLGLDERVLTDGISYEWYYNRAIDWASVNKKMDIWRRQSLDFLLNNIK